MSIIIAVDAEEVHGPGDIQRIYVLMSPERAKGKPASESDMRSKAEDGEKKESKAGPEAASDASGGSTGHGSSTSSSGKVAKHRLLLIASKTFPEPGSRARVWAFVDESVHKPHGT